MYQHQVSLLCSHKMILLHFVNKFYLVYVRQFHQINILIYLFISCKGSARSISQFSQLNLLQSAGEYSKLIAGTVFILLTSCSISVCTDFFVALHVNFTSSACNSSITWCF